MAAGAALVAAVALGELAFGEACGGFFRQHGHAFGRDGQFVAENDLTEPGAAQDRAGARGSGLLGKCGGESKDASAALVTQAVDALPVRIL